MDIKTLAIEQAKKSTRPECFEDYTEDKKLIRGFAVLISNACEWDGAMILEICRDALEDANFHAESEKVNAILNNSED